MKPAVSVIILIYKVEQYIEKCARSLFEQTLENVEYIFVNDCTPDASMSVLRAVLADYPNRLSQVRIIDNDTNMGQAASRKIGAAAASGEYVIYCDSDDWAESDYLSILYSKACAYNADAVVCRYYEDDTEIPSRFVLENENCKDALYGDLIAVKEMVSVWRFLFRRELYSRSIIFPDSNQGEDHAMVVQLAYYAQSIYCVDEPLYHWRVNMDSITRDSSEAGVSRRFQGASANTKIVASFLEREGVLEKYREEVTALKLYSMFYLRPLLRKGEGLKEFRDAFPEIKGHIISNKEITFVHKIEYLTDKYCPKPVIKTLYKWRKSSR